LFGGIAILGLRINVIDYSWQSSRIPNFFSRTIEQSSRTSVQFFLSYGFLKVAVNKLMTAWEKKEIIKGMCLSD
jgi:hypothetical protein